MGKKEIRIDSTSTVTEHIHEEKKKQDKESIYTLELLLKNMK